MKHYETKVLLIEDDINVRTTIKMMLERMNISNITEIDDSVEALDYMKKNPDDIDMVLCDWNLPQMTGLELLKTIRKTDQNLPFIMVTARADEDSIQQAKEDGVTSYICKPVDFKKLEDEIIPLIDKG